jgi:hypothetical protein
VIQLIGKVYITGVSLEHIPSVLSPTGETASAPKDFSVWVNLELFLIIYNNFCIRVRSAINFMHKCIT